MQFEGDIKIFPDTWYIKQIKYIINHYYKSFQIVKKCIIFIQIVQNKKYKKNDFIGGFSSYNAVELILFKDIADNNNKILVKQILAHEILHLFFPSISSKYGCCYNEGLLDYLSTVMIFSPKNIKYLTIKKMDQYKYYKLLNTNNALLQEKPYMIGFLYGFLSNNSIIMKIIIFIRQYLKERKYMLINWNNKKYIKFIKNNLFINKFCKQYVIFNV